MTAVAAKPAGVLNVRIELKGTLLAYTFSSFGGTGGGVY